MTNVFIYLLNKRWFIQPVKVCPFSDLYITNRKKMLGDKTICSGVFSIGLDTDTEVRSTP